MTTTYIIGIGGMIILAVLWVIVQNLWRDSFSDDLTDEDVLAGRSDCSGCGCMVVCKQKLKKITKTKSNQKIKP